MADACIPSFFWFQQLTAKSFLALQLDRLGHRRMSDLYLVKPKSKPRANIAACRSRIPLTPSTAPTLHFPLHRANSSLGSAEANLNRSSRGGLERGGDGHTRENSDACFCRHSYGGLCHAW